MSTAVDTCVGCRLKTCANTCISVWGWSKEHDKVGAELGVVATPYQLGRREVLS